MDAEFHEINFSPFFNNVLDYTGERELVTRDGTKVRIENGMRGFMLYLDGTLSKQAMSNIECSATLNRLQVGRKG